MEKSRGWGAKILDLIWSGTTQGTLTNFWTGRNDGIRQCMPFDMVFALLYGIGGYTVGGISSLSHQNSKSIFLVENHHYWPKAFISNFLFHILNGKLAP